MHLSERLVVIGGRSSSGHKLTNRVLSVEGNPGSSCSNTTALDTAQKYGATGGLLANGDVLVCGGTYGNFTIEQEKQLPSESWECILYMMSAGTKKPIGLFDGRLNSASIVIENTLFITGGETCTQNLNSDMYLLSPQTNRSIET